jgi:hypothetical protein
MILLIVAIQKRQKKRPLSQPELAKMAVFHFSRQGYIPRAALDKIAEIVKKQFLVDFGIVIDSILAHELIDELNFGDRKTVITDFLHKTVRT